MDTSVDAYVFSLDVINNVFPVLVLRPYPRIFIYLLVLHPCRCE